MNCHVCRNTVPEHAKFCPHCGSARVVPPSELRHCPQCGFNLMGGAPPATHGHRRGTGNLPSLRGTGTLPAIDAPERTQRSDRRVVTVLFLDVSGFTAMSEKLDPEQVTDIVNQFFAVLTEPIYRFGGVVDKYMGDAIMALFGAPVAHEDDPERAVRAALEMQKAAVVFSEKLEKQTGITLRVRIGINTGLVVAGVVGGAQKKDYTVMGDAVNLAQRMESNARPGKILVTGETYRQSVQRVDFLELDPIMVKGKSEPIPVYEVVGLRTDQGQASSLRRMVGREDELDLLRRAFESSMEGQPQAVFVTGEAGIGKSQLFTQFAAQLDPSLGVHAQRVRAISYEQGTPYGLLATFIKRWLGFRGKAESEISLSALQNWAGTVPFLSAEMVGQVVTATAYLLGLDTGNAAFEQLSPQQRRVMAFNAFNTALLSCVQARPMVLDFEDMHWADDPSVEWIQSLFDMLASRQFQASRLTIVCMARPSEDNPIPDWKPRVASHYVELHPLSEKESWSLIGVLLDCDPTSEDQSADFKRLLDRVQARAEGNPLFLSELVRSLVDSGAIAKGSQGRWQVNPQKEPTLPSTVNGVLTARFDRLPDRTRQVLQVASVIGREFNTRLVGKAGGLFQVEKAFEELVQAEFVRARSSEEFLFYLALTHEVVYNSLLLSTRRDLHRRVGEMLENEFGDRSEETPQVLARHFQLAGASDKALHYLFLSGQQAHRHFANQEALNCFTECLAIIEKGGSLPAKPSHDEVLLALADILATIGQYDTALVHLENALALQADPAQRAETLRRLGSILNLQGKYREAMERYEQGLEAISSSPDRLTQARILQDQALSLFRQGQYAEVVALCQDTLSTLEGSSHLKEVAMAESILGLVCYRQNHLKDAESYHRSALEKREAIEDLFGIASSLNNLGVLYREGGEWHKASEHYLRSLKIYQQIGDVSRQIIQLINLSDLLRNQGELELSRKHYKQVLDLSEQSHDAFGRAYAALGLGMVLLDEGETMEAVGQLSEGIDRLQEINAREVLPEALVALAKSYLQEGLVAEANDTLKRALDLARENSSSQQIGMALGVEALLKLKGGDVGAAHTTIQVAVKELREGGSLIDLARGLAIEAVVLQASGVSEQADERRDEAEAIFKQLGASLDLRHLHFSAADR